MPDILFPYTLLWGNKGNFQPPECDNVFMKKVWEILGGFNVFQLITVQPGKCSIFLNLLAFLVTKVGCSLISSTLCFMLPGALQQKEHRIIGRLYMSGCVRSGVVIYTVSVLLKALWVNRKTTLSWNIKYNIWVIQRISGSSSQGVSLSEEELWKVTDLRIDTEVDKMDGLILLVYCQLVYNDRRWRENHRK